MTRNERIARMESILAAAQKDKRMLTDAETKEFDGHKQAIEVENTGDAVRELDQQRAALKRPQGALREVGRAPAVHTSGERKYSLSRLLRSVTGDRAVDAGYELEQSHELARNRERQTEG